MNPQQKLLDNCYKEIGYKAANAAPPNRYNKYAEYLDSLRKQGVNIYNGNKNGYHWCDVFVDYMFISTFGIELGMKLLCQEYNGLGAGCTYSARYYQKNNQLLRREDSRLPQVGDQIFFGIYEDCSHTGIVTKVDNLYVYTIEGNTNNSVGERKYRLNDTKIYGYGRPDWSLVPMDNRYNTINDIPEGFYRDSIQQLIDKGFLSGKGGGVLDLTEDMIRCLIISARMCGVI